MGEAASGFVPLRPRGISRLYACLLFYRLPTNLLAAALARQCLLDAFLLARFQVEGVLLDFLNDVFLLDLSLEPSQRIFDGLAILNPNLCQSIHPPSGCNRVPIITYFRGYGDLSLVL